MVTTSRPKKQRQPEAVIRRAVRQFLEVGGWWVVPIVQSALSYKGIPDLVAMRDSTTVWIEVKTATGRLSEAQEAFAASCAAQGVPHIVARGVEDVTCLVDCLPLTTSEGSTP